jgi:hypothetical protein
MEFVPHLRERSFEDLGGLRAGDPGISSTTKSGTPLIPYAAASWMSPATSSTPPKWGPDSKSAHDPAGSIRGRSPCRGCESSLSTALPGEPIPAAPRHGGRHGSDSHEGPDSDHAKEDSADGGRVETLLGDTCVHQHCDDQRNGP